jgi:preprotein translocase subunit SecG
MLGLSPPHYTHFHRTRLEDIMNRTTALLLSLFLITGSALAQDEGSQTFPWMR